MTYGRALSEAPPQVRQALAVGRDTQRRDTILRSATIEAPGLVVLPVAIFK